MKLNIIIRKATKTDYHAIWQIIEPVIQAGDTYVFKPNSTREEMLAYWCGEDKHTYVAVEAGKVQGTFILKDNYPGLGAHVANGSYMTAPNAFGKGIGRAMGEFSIAEALRLNYKAIQFNLVVKTNERAVKLWQKLGFEIIGEIPEAFNHKELGLVNAYIMWRKL
jgi:L-amino acid N-acyltransferase YncA